MTASKRTRESVDAEKDVQGNIIRDDLATADAKAEARAEIARLESEFVADQEEKAEAEEAKAEAVAEEAEVKAEKPAPKPRVKSSVAEPKK